MLCQNLFVAATKVKELDASLQASFQRRDIGGVDMPVSIHIRARQDVQRDIRQCVVSST